MTMMRSANKTREQLIGELTQMRQQVIELKTLEKELQHLEWTLKELQCLSGIADIAESPGIALDEIYQEVATLVTKSYQYPEITCSRITVDGKEFSTDNYKETEWRQSADIEANDATIGKVEVNYLEERPVIDEGPFLKTERLLIDTVAERLGHISARKRAECSLTERVKELQCLSGIADIADIAESPGITLDEICQEVATLVTKSYQYPEITCSRITIDGKEFSTDNYKETEWRQSADIEANDATIGKVEVNYLEERPVIDEGPFLKTERLLIDTVAERLGQITARKRAETERRRLEQKAHIMSRLAFVGEIASGIAHKINDPLTGVISFTSLLMQKDIPEDIKGDVEIINEGSQQIVNVVNRLLTFASQCKPERAYVDINHIIVSTLDLRDYEMKTSNIHVITRLDPDLPRTIADGAQLQQVFLNIIMNAETEMKLAHGEGNLFIKTETIDNTIRISFKDDGPGIAKEDLERIFDPLFATREASQGIRLGLSICHGIITEHGGRIYAESVSGKGATFIVELPVVTEPEELKPAEPVADETEVELPVVTEPEESKPAEPVADETESVEKAQILVVGNELPILQFVSRVLTEEGHEVETVDNAQYALERLKSKKYSLVLLDTQPGASGIELIELYESIQKIAPPLARRVAFITNEVIKANTKDFLNETKAPHIDRPAVQDITRPLAAKQLKTEIDRILAQGA